MVPPLLVPAAVSVEAGGACFSLSVVGWSDSSDADMHVAYSSDQEGINSLHECWQLVTVLADTSGDLPAWQPGLGCSAGTLGSRVEKGQGSVPVFVICACHLWLLLFCCVVGEVEVDVLFRNRY